MTETQAQANWSEHIDQTAVLDWMDSLNLGEGPVSQASILGLYDPDRSDTIREKQPRQTFTRSWDEFDEALDSKLTSLAKRRGDGLALLLEPTASCSRKALLKRIKDRFPAVRRDPILPPYRPCAHQRFCRCT